jgi:hypothetical protein
MCSGGPFCSYDTESTHRASLADASQSSGVAMSDIDIRSPDFGASCQSLRPAPERRDAAALLQKREESEYREMEDAFRASGGLAGSELMTALLCANTDQPISMLARWIVAHDVLGFEWRGRTLVPLFQFDPATMSPRPAVSDVVRELVPVLTEWDISLWFARPNAWLGEAAPVDAIAREPDAVLQAARADRYVAGG